MEDFVSTRGSQINKSAVDNFVAVNYKTPKKKSKSTNDTNSKDKKSQNDSKLKPEDLKKQQEIEMRKARYDIIKFGISGFEKSKAKKAKMELAISLGAIPLKNRRKNYKILKQHQEKEKKRKKEEKHMSGFTHSLLKPRTTKVRRKDGGILGSYGKVQKTYIKKHCDVY